LIYLKTKLSPGGKAWAKSSSAYARPQYLIDDANDIFIIL